MLWPRHGAGRFIIVKSLLAWVIHEHPYLHVGVSQYVVEFAHSVNEFCQAFLETVPLTSLRATAVLCKSVKLTRMALQAQYFLQHL